jgi:hypothetical protein
MARRRALSLAGNRIGILFYAGYCSKLMSVTRYELLKIFVTSKERGTAIGLRLPGRKQLLITTIAGITGRSDDDTFVELNNRSIYGDWIEVTRVHLREIQNICNLRILFADPFYVHLRSLRENIRCIREESMNERVILTR